ncbi:MAG: hypothetical protein U9Q82_12960 [Chloroflexota bacterium]|nr:hypothetical protein [Chloroflexota bacterium]
MNISYEAGSLWRTLSSLEDNDILQISKMQIKRTRLHPLLIAHLTKRGRGLCYELNWPPYESELERMRRLHEKGKQSEESHTCATLAFTYQARLRGLKAGVMPEVEAGHFVPDAVVFEDDERILVEVEMRRDKRAKWRNMAVHQESVAICARTAAHRKTLIGECRDLNIPGKATDLRTLFLTSRHDPPGEMWLSEW